MLFDLEPYLPFPAFVVLATAAIATLVVWADERRHK